MDLKLVVLEVVTDLIRQYWWVGLIVLGFKFLKSPTFKGLAGEWCVEKLILNKLPKESYTIISDVLLPTKTGGTTQIDHLVISEHGIFVVEMKNYKGFIYGREKDKNWTQKIKGRKYRFYSPIRQNEGHIRALSFCTNLEREKFLSIITFWGGAKLAESLPDYVIPTFDLKKYILNTENEAAQLTPEEVESAHLDIMSARIPNTRKNKLAHKKRIKKGVY